MSNYLIVLEELKAVEKLEGSPAKPGQIEMYKKLVAEKNLEALEDFSKINGSQLYRLNAELLKYRSVSEAQKKRIADDIGKLESIGVQLKLPEIDKLTGGMDGTASKLIYKLEEIIKSKQGLFPATENQVSSMSLMFLCPDVPFEDYGISRKVELPGNMWRRKSPQEFMESLKELTFEEASEIIGKYKPAFQEWSYTRISNAQVKRIQQLELRLAEDYANQEVVEIEVDGEIIDLTPSKSKRMKGEVYKPLDLEQLLQFSKAEADEFIKQLERETTRSRESSLDTSEQFEFTIVHKDDDLAYEEAISLLYQLQAIAGWDSEEILDAFTIRLVQDDSPESFSENKKVIREFMTEMIETGATDFFGLMEFIRDSRSLQRIFLNI